MNGRRMVGAAILAICLGAPIVETFDQWDDTLHDGYDTEANLVVVALCVGLAMSAVCTISAWIRQQSTRRDARPARSTSRRALSRAQTPPPIPTSSPPLALRI